MMYEPRTLSISKLTKKSKYIKNKISFIHLSDIHIERITIREIKIIKELKRNIPDFIFLTGDYLNLSNINDPKSHAELIRFLKLLKSNYGIFGCLGSPPVDKRDFIKSILEKSNVTLLDDKAAIINLPHNDFINLVGINCDHIQDLDKTVALSLLENNRNNILNILLFHSPEIMPFVKNTNLDIYLCGHTHGGQIRVPFYGAIVTSSVTGKKYEMGSYIENGTHLYVSRGIGLEGKIAPRMRLFCKPEIIHWDIYPE